MQHKYLNQYKNVWEYSTSSSKSTFKQRNNTHAYTRMQKLTGKLKLYSSLHARTTFDYAIHLLPVSITLNQNAIE